MPGAYSVGARMSDLILPRRQFLVGGLASLFAAPAIVRAASLMKVNVVPEPGGVLYWVPPDHGSVSLWRLVGRGPLLPIAERRLIDTCLPGELSKVWVLRSFDATSLPRDFPAASGSEQVG